MVYIIAYAIYLTQLHIYYIPNSKTFAFPSVFHSQNLTSKLWHHISVLENAKVISYFTFIFKKTCKLI